MAKFNNDQVSGAVWIAIGIAVALGSLRYGLGPLESPGTGFPRWPRKMKITS